MREIKFKVWDNELKIWIWNLGMKPNNVLVDGKEKGRFSVLQYTGLKDKNGKEIYENDIVKMMGDSNSGHFRTYKGQVFCNSAFEGMVINCDTKNYMDLGLKRYEYEVIGNIYENPELLQ